MVLRVKGAKAQRHKAIKGFNPPQRSADLRGSWVQSAISAIQIGGRAAGGPSGGVRAEKKGQRDGVL
ncbi:MAG: hypothetical protein KKD92_05865 [Proteobacteria bacterium]|nr:hypothetical protein [Pseudomonadota bacterium]